MHTWDPYTIVDPRPCWVGTPNGTHHGLVIGRCGARQLVVHGENGYDRVAWTPSEEAWVLGPSDWAPWNAGLAANA